MPNRQSTSGRKERLRDRVWQDIRQGDLPKTLIQDLQDLYEFYIDPKTRERLSKKGRFGRWFHAAFLITKQAILRLTPGRRIILLLSLVFALSNGLAYDSGNHNGQPRVNIEFKTTSYALLLLVLMLELKDKLLARDELEAGRQVQLALLPDEQPRISGWDVWLYTRPANDVGGDLIDHLPITDDRHGLSLGDVAGKGLGAALLAAKLQATVRALAPLDKGMEWLGKELNRIFCRDCMPNRFATLIYMELYPASGTVEYLNAGHLPPLVLRGFDVEELPQGDPALGLMRDTVFHPQKVDFNSGDLMVIFSDGLSEAQNMKGEFYGERRIKKLIEGFRYDTAEGIGRKILSTVQDFIGNARPHDDLSLIVIRRRA